MNDPWDVKSVRQSGQYVSCMKINGIPLLPPVLSKECRREMQYYKLLAKEIEKRLANFKPLISDSDLDSNGDDDKTDAPELPDCEQSYELHPEEIHISDTNIDKATAIANEKITDIDCIDSQNCMNIDPSKNLFPNHVETEEFVDTSRFVIDFSLKINENTRNIVERTKSPYNDEPGELPERDCENLKSISLKQLTGLDTHKTQKDKEIIEEIVSFSRSVNKDSLNKSKTFSDMSLNKEGSSISTHSFTGSLTDIHKESKVDSNNLIRQRSYTVLNPSPHLLAHLEIQSINTGVEMNAISMTESMCNLNSTSKKRKSWDLQSAKEKWSSMAIELDKKNIANCVKGSGTSKTIVTKPVIRKGLENTNLRPSSLPEKTKLNSITNKHISKHEQTLKNYRNRFSIKNNDSNHTVVKESISPKPLSQKIDDSVSKSISPLVGELEDPGSQIRELYDRIQKQQVKQMTSLMEKQKREQMLLKQVFEEQNNLLCSQLKMICPKPTKDVKAAWLDKVEDPAGNECVSLSQLMSPSSPEHVYETSMSSTLTNTNSYINQCDDVLRKSRGITSSLKKQQKNSPTTNGAKTQSPKLKTLEQQRMRSHSPEYRNTSVSRRLKYEASISTNRDCELILTDRTNDTLADLNVTLPSDKSDGSVSLNYNVAEEICEREPTLRNSVMTNVAHYRKTDSSMICMGKNTQNSIRNICMTTAKQCMLDHPLTERELVAATKIVAYAKGFLVRRLMKTERVQSTVQTIKDALLCALQLHQDREGIRGADVDLHRRLIQQITAACYTLHDTFIGSSASERCAMLAADRARRRDLANRQNKPARQTDVMSTSHSGAFPTRPKRFSAPSAMTQSTYGNSRHT